MKTDDVGKIYIHNDAKTKTFVVLDTIIQEYITVYTNLPENEDENFLLNLSFAVVNFLKTNHDIMYLNAERFDNLKHEIYTDDNITLKLVYDEETVPLNYFYKKWQTEDENIVYINDD